MDQQNTQPIFVQSASKSSAVDYIFIAAAVVGVGYFGKRWWVKFNADKEAGKIGSDPAAQAASNIYNAKHWYGNTPDVAFDVARTIATNKIPWKDVADSFNKSYNDNINNYLDFLGAEKKVQFFNILNLTQDKDTKFTGKPPLKANLQYDVIKNYCFAIAIKGSNIRKSPEIMSDGGAISFSVSNNIIATAEINQPLGMMTGVYQLSKDGKTSFVEFYGSVWSSSGMQLKKVWVAASNIKVLQFPKATMEAEAKAYMKTQFLRIDAGKFNKANS